MRERYKRFIVFQISDWPDMQGNMPDTDSSFDTLEEAETYAQRGHEAQVFDRVEGVIVSSWSGTKRHPDVWLCVRCDEPRVDSLWCPKHLAEWEKLCREAPQSVRDAFCKDYRPEGQCTND